MARRRSTVTLGEDLVRALGDAAFLGSTGLAYAELRAVRAERKARRAS
ncbi:MAG: hypothetical protein ABIS21_05640 [Acidimicrobiales bacterium]